MHLRFVADYPPFRSLAIDGEQRLRFVDLLSRAVENSAPDASPVASAPVPRWGWGVAPPYLG